MHHQLLFEGTLLTSALMLIFHFRCRYRPDTKDTYMGWLLPLSIGFGLFALGNYFGIAYPKDAGPGQDVIGLGSISVWIGIICMYLQGRRDRLAGPKLLIDPSILEPK